MSSKVDYASSMPRIQQGVKGKIRTFTGKYVDPLKMRAADVCIEDIAHHLSNFCRYVGACPYHYSVAQHSLYVSEVMERKYPGSKMMALAGLLHDASEAYLGDMSSPMKHNPAMKFYRDIEHETGLMIFCVFGLDPKLMDATKPADDEVFFAETRTWWDDTGLLERAVEIKPLRPQTVEWKFLQRFEELTI
jgi:hypothetical protein